MPTNDELTDQELTSQELPDDEPSGKEPAAPGAGAGRRRDRRLRPADIAEYGQQGYLVTPLLSDHDLADVLSVAARLQHEASGLEHSSGDFNLEAPQGGYAGQDGGTASYRGVLRKVSRLVEHSQRVRDLSCRPAIVDLASALLGGDRPCGLVHSVLWFKQPRVGSAKPPHQDAPYLNGDPSQYVTIWIALDPSTLSNGCLEVVPGSHLDGPAAHAGVEAQVSGRAWSQRASLPLPLPAGTAVAFHPFLLHASGANNSNTPRRALMLRYSTLAPAHAL